MASSPTGGGDLRQELRGDAQTVTDTAKQRLFAETDARKGTAAEQAKSLSSALESAAGELSQSPDWLRSAFQKGAQSLQRFADTIEQKDSRQLTRDVQQLARQHPGTFLAGCAAAGFAAARVLKAGVEETGGSGAGGQYGSAGQSGSAGQYGSSGAGSSAATDTYDPYAQSSGGATPAFGGMTTSQGGQGTYAGEMP